MNDLLTFIGLTARANALTRGADMVADTIQSGKARLVCMASDLSPRTRSSFEELLRERQVPILMLSATMAETGSALGCAPVGILAVTDTGMAIVICRKAGDEETAAALEVKLAREKRRKEKKRSAKRG